MSHIEEARKLRPLIEKAVQSLTESEALEAKTLHPEWAELVKLGKVDTAGLSGYRFRYDGDGELYACVHGDPEFQEDWVPGVGTSALYVRVTTDHEGSKDDPIPADRGMEYTYGLYYLDPDDNSVYLCERHGELHGSVIVLHYLPHELIGQYFVKEPD